VVVDAAEEVKTPELPDVAVENLLDEEAGPV
jgi:hypothetical protein